MTASLYNNTNSSVLKSPFPNSLGGIASKYESRGGSKRRTKKNKKTRKTKKSKKTKTRGQKC